MFYSGHELKLKFCMAERNSVFEENVLAATRILHVLKVK